MLIDTLLNYSANWQYTLPRPFFRKLQNDYPNNYLNYSRSRSLTDAYNLMCTRYHYIDNYKTNPILILNELYTLLTNLTLKFSPYYMHISSEEANDQNMTIQYFTNRIIHSENAVENVSRIHIVHIPKGITYARKVLDTDPNTNTKRLKNIEMTLIQNVSHFIRIYKGFGNTPDCDITIFTSIVNPEFIKTIYIILPHLFNLIPDNTQTNEYNTKLIKFNAIFEFLWNTSKNTNTEIPETLSASNTALSTRIIDYINCFELQYNNPTNFITALANAKNEKEIKYVVNRLRSIENNIKNYEENLINYYTEKANLTRRMNATQKASPEDTETFLTTLKNNKAIEIIDTTNTKLNIRVTAPLQYFESKDFESYERNPNSIYNNVYKLPALRSIMHKIFVTREYRLLLQANIKLEINTGTYDDSILKCNATANFQEFTEFPNPHLYHFNCWDRARAEIQKLIISGNYDLVVLQIIAAVQSINVAESASFVNQFLRDFNLSNYQNITHIIDNTGTVRTLKELITLENEILVQEKLKDLKPKEDNQSYQQIDLTDLELDTDNNADNNDDNDDDNDDANDDE